jgi:hypothetical protein
MPKNNLKQVPMSRGKKIFVFNAFLPIVRGEKVSVSPKPATLTDVEQG